MKHNCDTGKDSTFTIIVIAKMCQRKYYTLRAQKKYQTNFFVYFVEVEVKA